jgi:hypothetical protein
MPHPKTRSGLAVLGRSPHPPIPAVAPTMTPGPPNHRPFLPRSEPLALQSLHPLYPPARPPCPTPLAGPPTFLTTRLRRHQGQLEVPLWDGFTLTLILTGARHSAPALTSLIGLSLTRHMPARPQLASRSLSCLPRLCPRPAPPSRLGSHV